jgi:hypothetical protein
MPLNAQQMDWLALKKEELKRLRFSYGSLIDGWDIIGFLRIIENQAREIRRLKTKCGQAALRDF